MEPYCVGSISSRPSIGSFGFDETQAKVQILEAHPTVPSYVYMVQMYSQHPLDLGDLINRCMRYVLYLLHVVPLPLMFGSGALIHFGRV